MRTVGRPLLALLAVALLSLSSGMSPLHSGQSSARAATDFDVTQLITDYDDNGNLWDSDSFIDAIDSAANVLAFKWGGTLYSTGVDDQALTGKTFTAQNWQALEVATLPQNPGHSDTDYYVFRGSADSNVSGFVGSGLAFEDGDLDSLASAEDLADLLNDGENGLNISTGLTNIPSGTAVDFPLNAINAASVGDGIPDILITQLFSPNNSDTFRLVDSDDATFGTNLSIALSNVASVAVGGLDATYLKHDFTGETNRSLDIRLAAFDFDELLGLEDDPADADILRWTPSGNSDPAFFAYNSASFSRLSQTITFAALDSVALAASPVSLSATASSGLSVGFESAAPAVCSVAGSALTLLGTGECVVVASQPGSPQYLAADSVTRTFSVTLGTFAISAPSSKVGTSDSSFTGVCASSCDVSGFAAADEIRVVVSKSDGSALSGRIKLTSTTGLTQSLAGYQSDATSAAGFAELGFEGTQAEVNAALETLQYQSPSGGGDETLGISATLAGASYFSGNGHYYKFVSGSVNWSAAKTAAAASSFNGLTGYLATITSAEENAFIANKTGGASAWVGGSDDYLHINSATGVTTFANQTDAEGHWYWVTGPEAGTEFWDEHDAPASDGRISGQFQYWNNSINQSGWGAEPNNSGSNEHYSQLLVGGTGNWNDLPNSSNLSYVIEYGDGVETPLKQASTTFDVGAPTAPLQVTGATASTGNGQVALSWTAPGSGGSAITDYVIEQSTDGGSTWSTLSDGTSTATSYTVTGLTNGTSYSFRVSAKNNIGTGTVSATVSATPAVPAPSGAGGSGGVSSPAPVVITPTPAQPRIITPPQPTPIPSILLGPVTSPGRGFDPSIGTRATVGGAPSTVTKRALPGGVSVQTGAFQFGMQLTEPQSGGGVDTNTPSNSPEIRVPTGQSTQFTGGGLLPGSQLQVWLPGRTGGDARELARVPVKDDGTFDTELSFTARQSETPVPIGRQVMQVAGFDENGNQTVVDMTINVSQGPIAPELNREQGVLPDLSVGSSLATSAGFPTPVTVVPFPEEKRVSVGDGSWNLGIDVDGETGVVGGTSEAPVIQVTQDSVGSASGDGFMPGTIASVWMFSDPTLMGTVTVGEDGSFTTEFVVDSQFLPVGSHTLQIQGVGDDGFIKAANLGVQVQEPVELTTQSATGLLWWVVGAFVMLLVVFFLVVVVRRRSRRSAN